MSNEEIMDNEVKITKLSKRFKKIARNKKIPDKIVHRELGSEIEKISFADEKTLDGIVKFLASHRPVLCRKILKNICDW